MLYLPHKLFNKETAKDLKDRLMACPDWVDGRETALGKAKEIKKNLQLKIGDSYRNFSQEILNFAQKDDIVKAYAFPEKFFSILFSRTGEGMFYGSHVDMPHHPNGRRDLSFTIFLNEPEEYKGGELVLNIPPLKPRIKLQAGGMIIYPTKYLHEVLKVTEGERFVCVGWIQSQIANENDRDILFNLMKSLAEIKKLPKNDAAFNGINLIYMNLYKRFHD